MKNEEIQAAVDSVESAISNLAKETDAFRQSERWKRILNNVGKFHKYSITNQFLIAHQCESATYVAGFQRWKSLGRHVVKGAKGIRILVPCAVKDRQTDGEDEREAEATGEEGTKQSRGSHVWFRTGYVFDIADTEGKPLDQLDLPPVLDDNGKLPLVKVAVESLGIEVHYEEFDEPGLNGISKNGHIAIRRSLPPGDMASVLIHEAAHELLHQGKNRERARELGKAIVEIEAESTAYVVMHYLGIESTANLYLTSYGADGKAIKAAIGRVSEASSRLITAIEEARKAQAIETAEDTEAPLAA